jgi:glycosyltransferase involved in cell wall biosynthesis
MENRIIVIVPFRNVAKYIQQCWQSLAEQEYGNYKLVFSDDCSSDGSLSLIPENEHSIRIRYDQRMYALANIYHSILRSQPEDEDIIAIVDGDDFLLHNRVFYKINEIYKQKDCLLTYGQYCTADGNMMYKTPYTKDEFRSLRTCDFRATHLKTFRFKLFKNFLKQDP